MSDPIVENPTYMDHIRHFFEEKDILHMGVSVSTYRAYDAVKAQGHVHLLRHQVAWSHDAARRGAAMVG